MKLIFTAQPSRERNRTAARFTHNGKSYTIHERTNWTSEGYEYKRRFICDSEGNHRGEASTIRQARKVLS